MRYLFIRQFVNMFNCIDFPCKCEDISYVSMKLAAHLQRMESMLGCGRVTSVACLKWEQF